MNEISEYPKEKQVKLQNRHEVIFQFSNKICSSSKVLDFSQDKIRSYCTASIPPGGIRGGRGGGGPLIGAPIAPGGPGMPPGPDSGPC